MVCMKPYLSLIVCPYDSLLFCWKFGTLSQVWDQFTVLDGNNSDLADILSVLLMTETLG